MSRIHGADDKSVLSITRRERAKNARYFLQRYIMHRWVRAHPRKKGKSESVGEISSVSVLDGRQTGRPNKEMPISANVLITRISCVRLQENRTDLGNKHEFLVRRWIVATACSIV